MAHNVSIDHSRVQVAVAKKFLRCSDVNTILQQVGGEGMPECVAGGVWGDTGFPDGRFYGPLEGGFVIVMPAALAGFRVTVDGGCREDPLPAPFLARPGILAIQGLGEFHPSGALPEVGQVLFFHPGEVLGQLRLGCRGKDRRAVLAALAAPYHDLVIGEVEVSGSQSGALQQAQARAIEQRCHQPVAAVQPLEDRGDLLPGHHHRKPLLPFGMLDAFDIADIPLKDVAVEEENRVQSLVLGGRADLANNGQRGEE